MTRLRALYARIRTDALFAVIVALLIAVLLTMPSLPEWLAVPG